MSLQSLNDSPIHTSNVRAYAARMVKQYPPLLLPFSELSPEQAKTYYQAATDQTPGNKLLLLEQALQHGCRESSQILINYSRPGDIHVGASALPTEYLSYLLAGVLCQAVNANAEFESVIKQCRRVDSLYECRDILNAYPDLGYDVSALLKKIELCLINLGEPFRGEREQVRAPLNFSFCSK